MSVGEEITPGDKPAGRRSFMRRHPILVGMVVILPVLYWFFGAGIINLPRFHWYSVTAEFVIDGKPITVSGTIECAKTWRDFVPLPLNKRGLPYARSANIIAKRLSSGVGLIVEPHHVAGVRRVQPCERAISGPFVGFPEGHAPRVYLLDNAEKPTRIERYEAEYFRSNNQRVKLISFSVKREGFGAFSPSQIVTEYYSSSLSQEIPWLLVESQPFHGAYATILHEDVWHRFSILKNVSDSIDHLNQITIKDFQNAANIAIDRLLQPGKFRRSINSQNCRDEEKAQCAEFNNIYGELDQPIYDVDATSTVLRVPTEPLTQNRTTFYREYPFPLNAHTEISAEIFGEKIDTRFPKINNYFYSPRKRAFLGFYGVEVGQQYFMRTDH